MPIQLNYSIDSLLIQMAPRMKPRAASLALEACSVLFLQLKEILVRLDKKLAGYGSDREIFEMQVAVCEIWEIIHVSHRLCNIFPLLEWVPGEEAQARIDTINELYRMFSNMPNQIGNYFSNPDVTTSIMGDFIWSYRKNMGGDADIFLCRTGEIMPDTEMVTDVDFKRFNNKRALSKYDGYVGVLSVDFLYVKSGSTSVERCELSIDNLVEWFNRVIEQSQNAYSKILAAQYASNPELDRGSINTAPFIAGIVHVVE